MILFKRIFLTIWAPTRAFEDIRNHPACLGAFLFIGLGSAVAAYTILPIFQKIYLLSVTESLNPEQLERIYHFQRTMRYIYPGGILLGTLLTWFISAFLIWLIVQVFEGRAKFKSIFSIISHASITSLITSLFIAMVVYVKYSEGLSDLNNLDIRFGADLFISDTAHPALRTVLANLNPFTLWYYTLLTIGIAIVCECNRAQAIGVIGTFWGISMGFSAGIAWVVSVFQAPPL